jgi:hypothetical protein
MKITNYERVKLWRQANPEKARAQRQRYYQSHAEILRAKRKNNYRLKKNERNTKSKYRQQDT